MTTVFKNVVTEIDTTGSAQLIFRCPTGKTALIKNLIVQNENGSNSNYFLAFEDNSISTTSYPIQYGTNTAGNNTVLVVPFVLEENDEILLQTSVADQNITMAYALMDTGVKQRYRMITKQLTTADSADAFLTCPTGSTIITNFIQFYNQSGSTASSNSFTMTDSSASATKVLDKGQINNAAAASYHRAFVLESGDSLSFTPDEQPMNIFCSYLEIRNPVIRGQ
jgi:hypothetical protein